jgi:hypothetical protein
MSCYQLEDYNRIKPNIISFGNGKLVDMDTYEYWPIYKVNNQMKFSYVLYDTINDVIFKANQPSANLLLIPQFVNVSSAIVTRRVI